MLTGYRDADFRILQDLDIKSLNRICQSNEIVRNDICSDKYFWEQKFEREGLTKMYFLEPTNYREWLKEFDKTFSVYKYAEYTLEIADVERTRKFRPETGIIKFQTDDYYFNNVDIFINRLEPKFLAQYMNRLDKAVLFNEYDSTYLFTLTPVNNDYYKCKIQLEVEDHGTSEIDSITVELDEVLTLTKVGMILRFVYYAVDLDPITDDYYIPYIISTELLQRDFTKFSLRGYQTIISRRGILEMLMYQDKIQI